MARFAASIAFGLAAALLATPASTLALQLLSRPTQAAAARPRRSTSLPPSHSKAAHRAALLCHSFVIAAT